MVYFMRKETKPEDPKEPENKGISCGTSYCSGEETCIEKANGYFECIKKDAGKGNCTGGCCNTFSKNYDYKSSIFFILFILFFTIIFRKKDSL